LSFEQQLSSVDALSQSADQTSGNFQVLDCSQNYRIFNVKTIVWPLKYLSQYNRLLFLTHPVSSLLCGLVVTNRELLSAREYTVSYHIVSHMTSSLVNSSSFISGVHGDETHSESRKVRGGEAKPHRNNGSGRELQKYCVAWGVIITAIGSQRTSILRNTGRPVLLIKLKHPPIGLLSAFKP